MSVIRELCIGSVSGKGIDGYREALEMLEGGIGTMTVAGALRADRVAALLAERELDALLVTNLMNVRYLTGFTGTNGLALISGDERLFVTDFRYVEQAAAQVPDFERVRGKLRPARAMPSSGMSGRVGFDDASMTVRQWRAASGARARRRRAGRRRRRRREGARGQGAGRGRADARGRGC